LQKYCEGEEGDDEDRKQVCTYFGKKFGKIYLVCLQKHTTECKELHLLSVENEIIYKGGSREGRGR